jgi:hypothetical protein
LLCVLPSCGFVRISLPWSICHNKIYSMVYVELHHGICLPFSSCNRCWHIALHEGASRLDIFLVRHVGEDANLISDIIHVTLLLGLIEK